MKRFMRAAWAQTLAATLFSTYLKFVYLTLRWTREGQERAEGIWAQGGGAILCFWHARIPLSPVSWPQSPTRQPMRALISRSNEGEFIAQAMQQIGFPAIRGSSKKQTDPTKNKYGEQAFRDMIAWVKAGNAVAITPDGPRGPDQVMQPGVPSLARVTGAPVLLVGMACKPCIRLRSWDRTVAPLPFGRAAMVWDGPLTAQRADDPEALASEWSARLTAVTDRAEALCAGRD